MTFRNRIVSAGLVALLVTGPATLAMGSVTAYADPASELEEAAARLESLGSELSDLQSQLAEATTQLENTDYEIYEKQVQIEELADELAVRRTELGESMSDYGNQLSSTNRRWQSNGDVTTMPRATYGDPMENNRFSDRWIEDASYLKLKEIYVSYKFNFLRGTTIFASAENVCTFTKYLGLDPETYYSYDSSMRGFDYGKISLPRSFKVGVKLEF